MNERTMVNDALTGINGELVRYGEMISQTGDSQLKQTLKQMRSQCEMAQEEIYQIPAAPATQEEIAHVRSIVSQQPQF